MTKTFKIGETALGGTIKVVIPKTLTTIRIDVISTNHITRSSCDAPYLINQYIYYSFDRIRIERDLFQIVSGYWSDQILKWITSKWQIEIPKNII
jgi:hypothetical protein